MRQASTQLTHESENCSHRYESRYQTCDDLCKIIILLKALGKFAVVEVYGALLKSLAEVATNGDDRWISGNEEGITRYFVDAGPDNFLQGARLGLDANVPGTRRWWYEVCLRRPAIVDIMYNSLHRRGQFFTGRTLKGCQ